MNVCFPLMQSDDDNRKLVKSLSSDLAADIILSEMRGVDLIVDRERIVKSDMVRGDAA